MNISGADGKSTIEALIDLDAGNDPDEWNVYLMSISQTKNLQRNS